MRQRRVRSSPGEPVDGVVDDKPIETAPEGDAERSSEIGAPDAADPSGDERAPGDETEQPTADEPKPGSDPAPETLAEDGGPAISEGAHVVADPEADSVEPVEDVPFEGVADPAVEGDEPAEAERDELSDGASAPGTVVGETPASGDQAEELDVPEAPADASEDGETAGDGSLVGESADEPVASAAPEPAAALAAAPSAVVQFGAVAAMSSSSSSQGNYGASPFATLLDFQVGGHSGGVTSYFPIPVPAPAAGPSPQVGLSYSSQAVDGMNTSTNNQSGPLGIGWSLTDAAITRVNPGGLSVGLVRRAVPVRVLLADPQRHIVAAGAYRRRRVPVAERRVLAHRAPQEHIGQQR